MRAVGVGDRGTELEVLEVLVIGRVVALDRPAGQRVLGADFVIGQRFRAVMHTAVLQATGLVACGHARVGEKIVRQVVVDARQVRHLVAGVVPVVVLVGRKAGSGGERIGVDRNRHLRHGRIAGPAVVRAALVSAIVRCKAYATGKVQGLVQVPGRLAEGGRRLHRFLGLSERALPSDGTLLRPFHDRYTDTYAVVLGGVIQA